MQTLTLCDGAHQPPLLSPARTCSLSRVCLQSFSGRVVRYTHMHLTHTFVGTILTLCVLRWHRRSRTAHGVDASWYRGTDSDSYHRHHPPDDPRCSHRCLSSPSPPLLSLTSCGGLRHIALKGINGGHRLQKKRSPPVSMFDLLRPCCSHTRENVMERDARQPAESTTAHGQQPNCSCLIAP